MTRHCNLQCAHCLRGPSQAKSLPVSRLDDLQSIPWIWDLLLTGGEPLLAPLSLWKALTQKLRHVPFGHFTLVTNGTIIPCSQTLVYLQDLARLSRNPHNNHIFISKDVWHDNTAQSSVVYHTLVQHLSSLHVQVSYNKCEEAQVIQVGLAARNGLGKARAANKQAPTPRILPWNASPEDLPWQTPGAHIEEMLALTARGFISEQESTWDECDTLPLISLSN
jgi:organic radical activating enzyme